MNNTSRFKFYGILTALILVVVGVVWFYPRKEHSSKVPHVSVKKPTVTGQAKPTSPKSATASNASNNNALPDSQPTFDYAKSGRGDMGSRLAVALNLNDEEVDQVLAILNSTRQRVNEIMADQATITGVSPTTVSFTTQLSDKQITELQKETYDKMFDVVGAERWKLFNDKLDEYIKSETNEFGQYPREYTFMGGEYGWFETGRENTPPVPISTAHVINFTVSRKGRSSSRLCMAGSGDNYESFKAYYGKIATMVLTLAQEQYDASQ